MSWSLKGVKRVDSTLIGHGASANHNFSSRFFNVFILAGSTTLEGKKFTCPKKTETFECDAAKRVPEEFNRGTSYKINDLKSPSDEKESEIYCRKNTCSVKKNKLYGRVQILEKNATRMTFQMMNLNDSLRFSCDVDTAPEYQVTEFHTKDFTTVECKLNDQTMI